MTTASLPDAGRNWVDRHAPERLRPWLRLGRFDRPIGVWLLLLPGWQGITLALVERGAAPASYVAWLFAGFVIGSALMRAAGCAFNDIVDRDFDARVARTALRPIPAGQISVKGAWLFLAACSLVSLGVLLTLNVMAVLLGVASLLLVAAYPFMKRITWWPQAWLGLTFNWGALLGYAAASGGMLLTAWLAEKGAGPGGGAVNEIGGAWLQAPGRLSLAALLLYAGGVFWTLGYDTIYALQDIEDDALIGVKSSARRLGGRVRPGVAAFYVLAALCAGGAGLAAGLGPLFWAGLAVYAAHLGRQVLRLRNHDAALALFRSNREAGLILLAAIAMGAWIPSF